MFFKNLQSKPANQCADNDGSVAGARVSLRVHDNLVDSMYITSRHLQPGHNVDAIDSLTMLPPIVVSGILSGSSIEDMCARSDEIMSITRRSRRLAQYTHVYVHMLANVLKGKPLQVAAQEAGETFNLDVARMVLTNFWKFVKNLFDAASSMHLSNTYFMHVLKVPV